MRLFHFTCEDHGAPGIREDGVIRPSPLYVLDIGLTPRMYVAWLTDLPDPRRYQVGLTSQSLTCDRMAVRFEADVDAERWRRFARRHRDVLPGWWRRDLERFGDPWHWFVSTEPVPVALEVSP